MGNSYVFVLAQLHCVPLFKVEDFRKLECFSEKRFEELKRLIRGFVFFCRDKQQFIPGKCSGIQHMNRNKGRKDQIGTSYCSFTTSKRERSWWDKQNWKDVKDAENLWGDLSREEEYFLKDLLKGEV